MSDPKSRYDQYQWQPKPTDEDGDSFEIPEFLARQMPLAPSYRPVSGALRALTTGALLGVTTMIPLAPAIMPSVNTLRRQEQQQGDGDGDMPKRPELTPEQEAALAQDLDIPAFLRRSGAQ